MHFLDICQYLAILYGVEIFKSNAEAATTTEGIKPRVYREIKKICKEHGIIHDVIGGAPEHKMKVAYNKDDYIDFGTFLTVDQIKEKPTLIEWPCSSNLLYTLMLISPDYPTRENPKEKEWQYWLVTNIHGGDLKLSQTLTEYSPPTEIHGKGPDFPTRENPAHREWIYWRVGNIPENDVHYGDVIDAYCGPSMCFEPMPRRFLLLVYKQPVIDKCIQFEEIKKRQVIFHERAHFSTLRFAEKYGFDIYAHAGNFFLVDGINTKV